MNAIYSKEHPFIITSLIQNRLSNQSDLASLTIVSKSSLEGEIWTTRLFGKTDRSSGGSIESSDRNRRNLCHKGESGMPHVRDQRKLFWKGRIKNEIYRLSRNQLITINESRFVKLHENFLLVKRRSELVEITGLPLFNKPEDHELPEAVRRIAEKIEAADGVIISTPEYDHAVPASLINALNWLSYGIFPFVDKPVMITGASYGSTLGSSRAQAHLRQILDSPELKARIMPSSEFLLGHSLQAFDEQGRLKDEEQVHKIAGTIQ